MERPEGDRHVDEGTIHAWLDDALEPSEALELEEHIAGCVSCRAAVAEARGLMAASARILRALDDAPWARAVSGSATGPRRDGGGTAPDVGVNAAHGTVGRRWGESATPARPRHRWRIPAAAAAVAVLAVGTTVVLQRSGSPSTIAGFAAEPESAAAGSPAVARAAGEDAAGGVVTPPPAPVASGATVPGSSGAAAKAAGSGAASVAADAERAPADELANTVVNRPAEPAVAMAPPIVQRPAAVGAGERPVPQAATALLRTAPVQVGRTVAESALVDEARSVRQVGQLVAGRVVGRDGQPLPQVRVALDAAGQVAVTDVGGRFRFAELPVGEHVVRMTRNGSEPVTFTMRVVTGGDSGLTVTLISDSTGRGMVALDRPLPGTVPESVRHTVAGASATDRAAAAGVLPAPVAIPPVSPLLLTPAAQRTAGCYRLEVGGAPGSGRDEVEMALPGWVQLHLTAAPRMAGWLAAEPLSNETRFADRGAGWKMGPSDEVELVWPTTDAARVVVLRLRGAGEVLVGTAALRVTTAAAPGETEVASVVAVRSICKA